MVELKITLSLLLCFFIRESYIIFAGPNLLGGVASSNTTLFSTYHSLVSRVKPNLNSFLGTWVCDN